MFKCKAEPLGDIATTKKGDAIRKFLIQFPNGSKDAISVWASAADRSKLEVTGIVDLEFGIGDMVFAR